MSTNTWLFQVHWVVTEYGAVNLFGLNLRQRLHALIGVAHPKHRAWLETEAANHYWQSS